MMVGDQHISVGMAVLLGPIIIGLAIAAVLTLTDNWKR